MPEQKPKPTYYKSGRGGGVFTLHSDRKMKAYTVFDGELGTLSMLNAWATLFYSLTATCASLAFGLWTDMFIEGSPSDAAQKQVPFMEIAFLIAAVVFLVLAIMASCSKKSEVNRIKRESSAGD